MVLRPSFLYLRIHLTSLFPLSQTDHATLSAQSLYFASKSLLIILFTLLSATPAFCRNFYVDDISRQIKQAIDRPLPKASEILGKKITIPAAPVLAIGYLENSDNMGTTDWGKAISWYLTETLNGLTSKLAFVTSYQYNSDGRALKTQDKHDRVKHLSRVLERTGAQLGITGSITINNDDTFDLILKLAEFPGDKQISYTHKNGQLDTIDNAVQEAATDLIKTALTLLYPTHNNSTPLVPTPEPGELETLADAFSKEVSISPEERVELFKTLWQDNPTYVSLSTLYLQSLSYFGDDELTKQALPYLLSSEATTVAFNAYRSLINNGLSPNGVDLESIANLKEIINENPNVIAAWFALDDAYGSEIVMYRNDSSGMTRVISPAIDHHPGYAKAIAISLETVKRWPNHYRSWWGLSYSLHKYAGLVRGTKYWRDIPENARRRYKNIMAIADDCLFQAIKRHPAQASLYLNKISLDINRGRDWRHSFRTAVELRPHDIEIYRTAFNFSRPQWGGSKEDMREVYELATRNNPESTWPQQLRDQWAPEIKPIIDLRSTKVWLIIGLLSLFILYWLWKQKIGGRVK